MPTEQVSANHNTEIIVNGRPRNVTGSVDRNRIIWARQLSLAEIERRRARERAEKDAYYRENRTDLLLSSRSSS